MNVTLRSMFLLFIFFCLALPSRLRAQGGTWVWVKGRDTTNFQITTFPPQGVSDTNNNPPPLEGAASWTDSDGNFWVFGGYSGNLYSDLWKYNPVTNIWTWIKGPGIPNLPGQYGARGISSDTTMPGARYISTTWTDANGDLWLFGGVGDAATSSGDLNDLWRYHIATNQWTWMSGNNEVNLQDIDNTIIDTSVYGIYQHPSLFNSPGGRHSSTAWTDDNDNLWLFGGARNYVPNDEGGEAPYNDVWKYTVATNEWTWMNGPNTAWGIGHYGTKGVGGLSNLPP